jgi:hypothetical protein
MSSRTATCSCGQLRIKVEGPRRGVGVCHCLACQRRTGSVFATLASFSSPFEVSGAATEWVRVGDQGASRRVRRPRFSGTSRIRLR